MCVAIAVKLPGGEFEYHVVGWQVGTVEPLHYGYSTHEGIQSEKLLRVPPLWSGRNSGIMRRRQHTTHDTRTAVLVRMKPERNMFN